MKINILGIIAAVILLVLFMVIIIRKLIVFVTEKNISAYQSSLIERHYGEVENMYRQTRGWRHDYRTHIQTMKAYLQMKEYDKLDTYLNDLEIDLTTVDTVIKTGNVMIDAILNSKISLAGQRKIKVDAKAIVPADLNTSVSEVDLSIVLGNLMDNAIEACQKIKDEDKRFIRVYIDILKGQLCLYVMNSSEGMLKRSGKLYRSTKTEEYHGFGLRRTDKVVEKYGGYLNRQDEEGVFATEVMLPL